MYNNSKKDEFLFPYLNTNSTVMRKYTISFFYTSLFCLFTSVITAQPKKYLSPDEYGKWQSLGATAISPNGEWVAYQITVQENNDTLFVINKRTQTSYKLEFASSRNFQKTTSGSLTVPGFLLKKPRNCGIRQNLLTTKWGC